MGRHGSSQRVNTRIINSSTASFRAQSTGKRQPGRCQRGRRPIPWVRISRRPKPPKQCRPGGRNPVFSTWCLPFVLALAFHKSCYSFR